MARRFEHVKIYQGIVVSDSGARRSDISDSSHIRRQVIDKLHIGGAGQAVLQLPKV